VGEGDRNRAREGRECLGLRGARRGQGLYPLKSSVHGRTRASDEFLST
jgi:hypothetical protein